MIGTLKSVKVVLLNKTILSKLHFMKNNVIYCAVVTGLAGMILSQGQAFSAIPEANTNIYKTISVKACDSLIKANELIISR
jgi:hypothetical protein